jgi:predicted CXXCH cytochrome family protein
MMGGMGTARAAAALALALIASSCARPIERRGPPAPEAVAVVRSNIVRADYAGSAACGDCHAQIYAAWQRSPMHRMTRVDKPGEIAAPFDGATLRVGRDTATALERGGKRYVALDGAADGRRLYRVTKVIGGRYREDYVGVDVTRAADPATGWNVEKILPVSFVYSTKSWRYKGYSVMVTERPSIRVQASWSQTCIPCHNTLPQLAMLYDDLAGPGAAPYQGTITDDIMPASRMLRFVALDEPGLSRAVAGEVARIGGAPAPDGAPLAQALGQAIRETRSHLGGRDLVEVGVGCETCHGGAAEHAARPAVRPLFEPRSPLLRAVPPEGRGATRAQWINRACARCHTVLFSAYPWTWEGGRRKDPQPGGSTTNSGEARDFLLGGCATQMSCADCHDPHAEDRRDRLDALAGPAGNAICARCHAALATPAGLRAHTHHAPGAGSACVGCHMPKKNMGLSYQLVRYHRIGSPTDEARVLGDRPLECALCHREKTVRQLVDTMERWWGKRYDRDRLRALYGDLDADPITSTLAHGKPHEQAVAITVLGERGAARDAQLIAPHLAHEYPLVRYYAKHAIERLTGAPVPIDVGQSADEIRAELQAWTPASAAPASASVSAAPAP